MKIWVDDQRPAPKGYKWLDTVNKVKNFIMFTEDINHKYRIFTSDGITPEDEIELIDLDHDAGSCAADGGDYIEILNWLEETNRNYPIRIHSANPVGVKNMRRIIERNGWTEVK